MELLDIVVAVGCSEDEAIIAAFTLPLSVAIQNSYEHISPRTKSDGVSNDQSFRYIVYHNCWNQILAISPSKYCGLTK